MAGRRKQVTAAVVHPERDLGEPTVVATRTIDTGEHPSFVLERFNEGDRLPDFDLLKLIGEGGGGRVFLARQQSMRRTVALKISSDCSAEPVTLAQLDHPGIVRVYDQRRISELGASLLYMQYVPGGTLRDLVSSVRSVPRDQRTGRHVVDAVDDALVRHGEHVTSSSAERRSLARLSWPAAVCRLGAAMARALAYAHSHGVVHRDVKPDNCLLDADGNPMLVDFNVSAWLPDDGPAPQAVFGATAAYMSPEQSAAWHARKRGEIVDVDGRSDVYSLAATLWELLFGQPPTAEAPPPPPAPATDIDSAALADILQRGLRADPDMRPRAVAFASELELCLRPNVKRLLTPPTRGWRRLAHTRPLAALAIAALIPNAIAGLCNYLYNWSEITARYPAVLPAFQSVQAVINTVAFPLGLLLGVLIARPITRALVAGDATPANLRRRSLALGHYAALIGVAEWVVAGIAFPVALWVMLGELPDGLFSQFATSLALSGLVAAAYPFYWITSISASVHYPRLAAPGWISEPGADEPTLARVRRHLDAYLMLAAAVPFAGVALLAFTGRPNQLALGALTCVGMIGFAWVFWMYRRIQRDLTALQSAAMGAVGRRRA